MAEKTKIAWCDHTFNPWWGCTNVSEGCAHCYAEVRAVRWGFQIWGPDAPRRFMGGATWEQPRKWNAKAEAAGQRRRVFCGSMCDPFEDRADLDDNRHHLFEIIADTPWLDWLLLTKRPENMTTLAPKSWRDGWPANVWALATIENQAAYEARAAILAEVPALVTGWSCEPLLGPIVPDDGWWESANIPDWIIVGCESGRYRRPCDLAAVRRLAAQARGSGVAVFVKQLQVNGRVEIDPRRWPEDLRIQEFPKFGGP